MLHTFAAWLLALAAFTPQEKETNEEKRDKKLKEVWLQSGGWITDYDKAREEAKKESKLIFAYFTRSYSP